MTDDGDRLLAAGFPARKTGPASTRSNSSLPGIAIQSLVQLAEWQATTLRDRTKLHGPWFLILEIHRSQGALSRWDRYACEHFASFRCRAIRCGTALAVPANASRLTGLKVVQRPAPSCSTSGLLATRSVFVAGQTPGDDRLERRAKVIRIGGESPPHGRHAFPSRCLSLGARSDFPPAA